MNMRGAFYGERIRVSVSGEWCWSDERATQSMSGLSTNHAYSFAKVRTQIVNPSAKDIFK